MKKSIFLLVAIFAVLGGYIALGKDLSMSQPQKTGEKQSELIEVSQTVAWPGSGERSFSEKVQKGTTALSLLQKTTHVDMKGEGENAFVTGINSYGVDDSKKEFWAFYVNGKQAEVGAGSYILQSGDKVEWKIETY